MGPKKSCKLCGSTKMRRQLTIIPALNRRPLRMGLQELLPYLNPEKTDEDIFAGRAWSMGELRIKSFEDLHKLWFVLGKERNRLLSEKLFRVQKSPDKIMDPQRYKSVKLSMARIKVVLGERARFQRDMGKQLEQIRKKNLKLINFLGDRYATAISKNLTFMRRSELDAIKGTLPKKFELSTTPTIISVYEGQPKGNTRIIGENRIISDLLGEISAEESVPLDVKTLEQAKAQELELEIDIYKKKSYGYHPIQNTEFTAPPNSLPPFKKRAAKKKAFTLRTVQKEAARHKLAEARKAKLAERKGLIVEKIEIEDEESQPTN